MAQDPRWPLGVDFSSLKDALLIPRTDPFDIYSCIQPTLNAERFQWPDDPKLALPSPAGAWVKDPYMYGLSDVGHTASTEYLFTCPIDQSWLIHAAHASHHRTAGAAGLRTRFFTRFSGASSLKCTVGATFQNSAQGEVTLQNPLWIPSRGVFGIGVDYTGNGTDSVILLAGVIILAFPAKACPVR